MSPQSWALTTFFIPLASAVAYGVWLVVSGLNLAHSTSAEKAVRLGSLAVLAAAFAWPAKPWARVIALASAAALVLALGLQGLDLLRAR